MSWIEFFAKRSSGLERQPPLPADSNSAPVASDIGGPTTRRHFVKAAAATAGLGAAGYVKPNLTSFGVPVALAVSGPPASCNPPCPAGQACVNGRCIAPPG